MRKSLEKFQKDRADLIRYLDTFTNADWQNQGKHPKYKKFNADIFMRHIIMHDHLHMYRIEDLWLTNDEFIND